MSFEYPSIRIQMQKQRIKKMRWKVALCKSPWKGKRFYEEFLKDKREWAFDIFFLKDGRMCHKRLWLSSKYFPFNDNFSFGYMQSEKQNKNVKFQARNSCVIPCIMYRITTLLAIYSGLTQTICSSINVSRHLNKRTYIYIYHSFITAKSKELLI